MVDGNDHETGGSSEGCSANQSQWAKSDQCSSSLGDITSDLLLGT